MKNNAAHSQPSERSEERKGPRREERKGPRRASRQPPSATRSLARTLAERLSTYERAARRLREAPDAEDSVHDFRVASRRLIGALQLAEVTVDSDQGTDTRRIRRKIKDLFSKLGPLRDLDVESSLAKELEEEHPVVAAFRKRLAKRARRARRKASQLACSRSLQRVVDETAQTAHHLERRLDKRTAEQIDHALAAYLGHREQQVRAYAAKLRPSAEAAFHQLRIGLKKVRYAAEVVANLPHAEVQPATAHATWDDMATTCKQFQDQLGHIQDLTVLEDDLRDFARRHPRKASQAHAAARAVAAKRRADMRAFVEQQAALHAWLDDFATEATSLANPPVTFAAKKERRGPKARRPNGPNAPATPSPSGPG